MAEWTKPDYPGDYVRIHRLQRRGEIGDVRIQSYSRDTINVRVGSFLPGRDVCLPGDTPKIEPERCSWHAMKAAADMMFDAFVAAAREDGWEDYNADDHD